MGAGGDLPEASGTEGFKKRGTARTLMPGKFFTSSETFVVEVFPFIARREPKDGIDGTSTPGFEAPSGDAAMVVEDARIHGKPLRPTIGTWAVACSAQVREASRHSKPATQPLFGRLY